MRDRVIINFLFDTVPRLFNHVWLGAIGVFFIVVFLRMFREYRAPTARQRLIKKAIRVSPIALGCAGPFLGWFFIGWDIDKALSCGLMTSAEFSAMKKQSNHLFVQYAIVACLIAPIALLALIYLFNLVSRKKHREPVLHIRDAALVFLINSFIVLVITSFALFD